MGTRALYTFIDGDGEPFHVYKHWDGAMGLQFIAKAKAFAWPLPRFEADEFAAAFVAANKKAGGGYSIQGGDVRLVGRAADWRTVAPSDIEFRYEVASLAGGPAIVRCWRVFCGHPSEVWSETPHGRAVRLAHLTAE